MRCSTSLLAAMRLLTDRGIRLNICASSNVMLDHGASLKSHAIRQLYDVNVLVTINTNDVLMFGQCVSDELPTLLRAVLLSGTELNRIRVNGLLSETDRSKRS
jgi:adenosine deaminase